MLQDIVCAAAENMSVCRNWLAFQQSGILCLGVAMVQMCKLQTWNKEGYGSSQTLTAPVGCLHDSLLSTVRSTHIIGCRRLLLKFQCCPVVQRAICEAYGIVINVITSDQQHWFMRYEPEVQPKKNVEVFVTYIAPIHYNAVR